MYFNFLLPPNWYFCNWNQITQKAVEFPVSFTLFVFGDGFFYGDCNIRYRFLFEKQRSLQKTVILFGVKLYVTNNLSLSEISS